MELENNTEDKKYISIDDVAKVEIKIGTVKRGIYYDAQRYF
jgi:translation initiation factor 6 (eIF-6)